MRKHTQSNAHTTQHTHVWAQNIIMVRVRRCICHTVWYLRAARVDVSRILLPNFMYLSFSAFWSIELSVAVLFVTTKRHWLMRAAACCCIICFDLNRSSIKWGPCDVVNYKYAFALLYRCGFQNKSRCFSSFVVVCFWSVSCACVFCVYRFR